VLKVGVVGTGNMGEDHVRRLAGVAGARVVAVSDVNVEQAERVAAAAGVARVHHDGLDLIGDDEVEAVLVASPGFTHEAFTLACVAAGKPVLCEKPLAPEADACLRIVQAEAALPRRLVQVGFMRRYDRGYRAVKQVLDAGSIGAPLLVHCVHRNATAGAGVTSDMLVTESVVHEIDVTRWLLGQEIVAVTVRTPRPTSRAPRGLPDPQLVLLETEAGVLVDVEVFVNCQYGYDVRCEVVGECGTVSLADPAPVRLRQQGRRSIRVPVDWRGRFAQAYHDELQAWVDGAVRGEITGPSAWDGYVTTAVAERCVRALAKGCRTLVELPERPALPP
jgi:myo-inositol 2-dehydrogenase/D-chiro-inositol 1-dehydrogenase